MDILSNLLALKQNWTYTRKPILNIDTDTTIPIPPSSNRKRIGTHSADIFIPSGIREMTCLLNVAETYQYINDNSVLLDWGVGCARVSRHLPKQLRANLIGIDVDPKNIKWCKDNISWGKYSVTKPDGVINCQTRQ